MKKPKETVKDKEVLCSQCQGKLVPSGCGCLNKDCTNYVGYWKKTTAGYEPPKK